MLVLQKTMCLTLFLPVGSVSGERWHPVLHQDRSEDSAPVDPAYPQVLERPVGQDGAARLGVVALLGGLADPLPSHRTLLKALVQLGSYQLGVGDIGPSFSILIIS